MLAIMGGKPIIPNVMNMHGKYPQVGATEHKYVAQALGAEKIWGPWGPLTRQLEEKWAERTGSRFCAAVNSGTAALHCAIVGAGVLPGDHVVIPAYTFIGTAGAVLMAGALPVFADVEPDTGNIDPASMEHAITERTTAVVVVHLHGQAADVGAINRIAARRGLIVIEDCAQAHGAEFDGRTVGGIFTAGAFSLNATKLLAGPEGGLLTTNSEEVYNRAADMRVFGVRHEAGRSVVRNADSIGYSYRTNELASAFALARLEHFDAEHEHRLRNAQILTSGLRDLECLSLPIPREWRSHRYQMYRIRVDAKAAGSRHGAKAFRRRLLMALRAEGAIWWTWETSALPDYRLFRTRNEARGGEPWCHHPMAKEFDYATVNAPVARATADDAIFTTSHFPPNDLSLMEMYGEAMRKVLSHVREVDDIPCEDDVSSGELVDFT